MYPASRRERYARQVAVIGEEGQERLASATVLIAGAGGLGSVIAAFLAASGVGRIRLVDRDVVVRSNLNRQFLYSEQSLGQNKAEAAQEAVTVINPETVVEAVAGAITSETVGVLAEGVALILDGMDNYATRYLLNRAAGDAGIPFVHGAVTGLYGQVTTIIPGETPCLRCIFPAQPELPDAPILGSTCGIIGCIQATEAIKYLTGTGSMLAGRLLVWDGMRGEADTVEVEAVPGCTDCGEEGRYGRAG